MEIFFSSFHCCPESSSRRSTYLDLFTVKEPPTSNKRKAKEKKRPAIFLLLCLTCQRQKKKKKHKEESNKSTVSLKKHWTRNITQNVIKPKIEFMLSMVYIEYS